MIDKSTGKQFEKLNPGRIFPGYRELPASELSAARAFVAARLGRRGPVHAHEELGMHVYNACTWIPHVEFLEGALLNRTSLSQIANIDFPESVLVAFEGIKRVFEMKLSDVPMLFAYSGSPGWSIGDGAIIFPHDARWILSVDRQGHVGWV